MLTEHWGWNRDLVRRLDALRKVLDGNAGKAMDFLIGRLAGHRREWEQPAGAGKVVAESVMNPSVAQTGSANIQCMYAPGGLVPPEREF